MNVPTSVHLRRASVLSLLAMFARQGCDSDKPYGSFLRRRNRRRGGLSQN
jgi:hypothetical protein